MGTKAGSAFSVPVNSSSVVALTNYTVVNSPVSSYLSIQVPSNVANAISAPVYTQVRVGSSVSGGSVSNLPVINIQVLYT